MKRLDRYIIREILTPGLIALVALTFIVFSRQAGMLLDIIIRQNPTASEIWAVAASILPSVLVLTLPMSLLMGILTGFSRISSDSEAIAMRASGLSMRRLLRPVLVLATLTWLIAQSLTAWVAPRATANLQAIGAELAIKYPSIELRPGVFYERPDWAIYVNESHTGRDVEMTGILLVNTKKPEEPEFTLAQSGTIASNSNTSLQITLYNSIHHVVTQEDPDHYQLQQSAVSTISISAPPSGPPREPPLTTIPTRDLWQHMRSGTATHEQAAEFHQRFALPFACFAFALLGLPMGVSTNRGGRSTGLVLSLILMFAYYLSLVGGTRATGASGSSPALGAWLPNIAFCILGIVLLARSDYQHENRIIAWAAQLLEHAVRRLASIKLRRFDLTRWAYTVTHRVKLIRLLDMYVLRGFWFFFGVVLSVLSSLFILVTLFELLPDIIRNGITAGSVMTYFAFLLPQIFYWVMPLAVLFAVLITLGTLTKTNEVLAVKAGAVSLYRMSLPLVLMSILLSGVIYLMQDYLLPWTNRRQDQYHDFIKGNQPQTYQDPSRKLMMGTSNRIYHYTFFDPAQNTFANISILTVDPKTFQVRERVFAKRATWNGSYWTLEEGWTRNFSENRVHKDNFDREPMFVMDPPSYFRREVREADQMTYSELREYVENLRTGGIDVGSLTVALYRKLSFPLVSFIMALIGIPFSFKTGRKGAFYGIGFCVAVGITYWLTFQLFEKLGAVNQLSPVVAAWFPNLIFGASGIWMMLRVKT